MNLNENAACAHSNVLYKRVTKNGLDSDSWVCRDCGTLFWPAESGDPNVIAAKKASAEFIGTHPNVRVVDVPEVDVRPEPLPPLAAVMEALPSSDPRMVAWKIYRASPDYANNYKWAQHESGGSDYLEGALWGAFIRGFDAARENGND